MSYSKLFGSILDSSIWQEPKHVKILWITMLAMKDQDGLIEAAVPGLAKRAGLSIDETLDGLKVLLAPDPWSRTPDHEGRRIETVDGGWCVLNHYRYRDKQDAEEQREKERKRKADQRARKATGRPAPVPPVSRNVPSCPVVSHKVTTSYADTDHPDGGGRSESPVVSSLPDPDRARRAERDHAREAPPLDPAAALRRQLVSGFPGRVNEARAHLSTELGLAQGVRPISLMGEGEKALLERLKESADPAGDLDHVIAVAVAEARVSRELRWLGWSLAEPKAWRTKLAATVAETRPRDRRSVFDVVDDAVRKLEQLEPDPEGGAE